MDRQYQDYQKQQGTFDEVNQILNNENQSNSDKQIEILRFKLTEMHKICNSLTSTNKKLLQKVQFLEQQIQAKNNASNQTIFNEQYSEMQCDFGDIEDIIKQYRNDLNKYQERISQDLNQKDKTIKALKEQITELKNNNEDLFQRIDQLEIQTDSLEQTRQNLIHQIDELQNSLKRNKFDTPRSKRNSQYIDGLYSFDSESTGFNMNVQLQLEKLIEKLIKELQHERSLKKKGTEQIKRLRVDITDLQKQIMSKNQKIYSLEMSVIKNGKINSNSIRNSPTNNKIQQNRRKVSNNKQRQTVRNQKTSKNFTIMQLMNNCIQLSSKQKLMISLKTIDIYNKKIQNQDYSSEILESVIVCNYNPNNPNSISIRINKNQLTQNNEEYERSQTEIVWNLAFILDNLFNQCVDRDKDFGKLAQQTEILQFINEILENREGNSLETIALLQKLVEQALTLRKRE